MIDPILQSPDLKLSGDSNDTVAYKRDSMNYITQLFGEQLPAIRNGFFNVHLNKNIIVQPHWHTNVTEMVILLHGEAVTTVFNPFTQKLMAYRLKPGQASIFPKGWFHWIVALADHTHLLTIFDEPTPDIVYGSDFLRFLPEHIVHLAYCVNEADYAKAVAPIQESVILGPPPGCEGKGKTAAEPAVNHAAFPNTANGWQQPIWSTPQANWQQRTPEFPGQLGFGWFNG
ncbi:cupin domain-containing protein [Paenibacillus protaetiae]|uniref:cupin domain-containing protein n=1 Tax=Paenibacillus protaetiae TaxID=2509456 RepID=UPI001FC949EE|nr:cupin domain-containing protein [Paenibacillus protaetiae]